MNTMQKQTTPWSPKKLTRPRGEKLKAERVQEKVLAMPGWQLVRRGKALYRMREFPDGQVAFAFASFAAALTARAGQRADVTLSGSRVVVTLHKRSRIGESDAVLDLARSLG